MSISEYLCVLPMTFPRWFLMLGLVIASASDPGGFLHLPLGRHSSREQEHGRSDALKRHAGGGGVNIQMLNEEHLYYVNFTLGTPGQNVSLAINTSISDFYVREEDSCLVCSEDSSIFDPANSSTFRANNSQFQTEIDAASGIMAQDVLHFNGIEIENFNFGVANVSHAPGSAGLGLAYSETVRGEQYANLPQQLKDQGYIQQVAYSMWLNVKEGQSGSLLFGAIDHSKYASDLYVLPLIPEIADEDEAEDDVYNFSVILNGLSAYDGDGNEQPFAACAIGAKFDTGSALSSFPTVMLEPFFNAVGTDYDHDWTVRCSKWNTSDVGIGFQLGGVDVTLDLKDLLVPLDNSESDECVVFRNSGDYAVIGNNILRNLYVVYDLENLELGIAMAGSGNGTSASSSIEVLSTGIPGSRISHDTRQATDHYQVTPITIFGTPKLMSSTTPDENLMTTYTYQASVTLGSSVTETIAIGAKPGFLSASSSASNSSSTAVNETSTTVAGSSATSLSSASGEGKPTDGANNSIMTGTAEGAGSSKFSGESVSAANTSKSGASAATTSTGTTSAASGGANQATSSVTSSGAAVVATGSALAVIGSVILSLL